MHSCHHSRERYALPFILICQMTFGWLWALKSMNHQNATCSVAQAHNDLICLLCNSNTFKTSIKLSSPLYKREFLTSVPPNCIKTTCINKVTLKRFPEKNAALAKCFFCNAEYNVSNPRSTARIVAKAMQIRAMADLILLEKQNCGISDPHLPSTTTFQREI